VEKREFYYPIFTGEKKKGKRKNISVTRRTGASSLLKQGKRKGRGHIFSEKRMRLESVEKGYPIRWTRQMARKFVDRKKKKIPVFPPHGRREE